MYEITKTDENRRTVLFTEDVESVGKQFKKIRSQITKDLEMPGFRPGKVPRSIIDKQYGNVIKAEVAENVRSSLTSKLLEEEDWILDDTDPEGKMDLPAEGKPYSFEITFSLFQTPKPEGISGISIQLPPLDMEKAVNDTLESFREKMVSFEKVDRISAKGDLILLEASPASGEEPPREFSVRIGDSHLGPGFDEIVTGLSGGDQFKARMEGGEGDQEAPLHHFHVLEVQESVLPELDDEFASQAAGVDTLDELREKVETSVQSRYEQELTYLRERTVVDSILGSNEFDPPTYMVDNLTRDYMGRLGEEEPSEETREAAREMAYRKVREFLILRQVAISEEIEIADSEIEKEITAGESRFSVLDRLRNLKAMEHIISLADIEEKEPDTPVSEEEIEENESGGWRWKRIETDTEEDDPTGKEES